MPAVATAALVEAFVSLQGEGPHAGAPTLFVRTAKCPLRCTYCDTVESYRAPERVALRDLMGAELAAWENPAPFEGFADEVFALAARERVRWLSLTGGEPTLWPDFGRALMERAQREGVRTHLETAAQDAEAFAAFLDHLDFASLDWKFPSTLRSSRALREAHLACVAAAAARGTAMSVKAVLTPALPEEEWRDMLAALRPFARAFTLVLQPVTPCLDEREALASSELLRRTREALAAGFELRVLPQIHKALGIA